MQASTRRIQLLRQRTRPARTAARLTYRAFIPMLTLLFVLLLWQLVTMLELYPAFIIPPPRAVVERFWEALLDGQLWLHTSTTVSQMLLGLLVGVSTAVTLGYFIAKSETLENALSPLIVAVQATPVVAYAPLLVIVFGDGATSKIVISGLIVFFPMLMNTIIGIRGVPNELHELMCGLNATRWQLFTKLEIPASLPILLGGLKVSATLAVIGAVVGEFVGAEAGLGRWINIARYDFDTPLVFVAVFMLAFIARTLFGVISWIERRVLAWQPARHLSS